jgi:hypothetical protein
MITVDELLSRAKEAIEAGEKSMRAGSEDVAAVQTQGAPQRQDAGLPALNGFVDDIGILTREDYEPLAARGQFVGDVLLGGPAP